MSIVSPLAVAVILGASLSLPAAAADPTVTAGQRSLKERGFYTGDATGVNDEATRSAVRRFQIREGLQVTGNLDAATSQALQSNGPARPTTSAQGGYTPSVRERAHSVVQSDREFLERVESVDLEEIAPPPPPPAAPARKGAKTAQVAPPPPEPPTKSRPVQRERAPAFAPERAPAPVASAPAPAGMSAKEAQRFVSSYLAAAERPSPEAEVAYYADQVDYFDQGKVKRKVVAQDQRRYYQRWPERDFTLAGAPKVVRSSPSGASIRFRVRYTLGGGGERAKGEVENFMRVRKTEDGYKIAAIRERKIR